MKNCPRGGNSGAGNARGERHFAPYLRGRREAGRGGNARPRGLRDWRGVNATRLKQGVCREDGFSKKPPPRAGRNGGRRGANPLHPGRCVGEGAWGGALISPVRLGIARHSTLYRHKRKSTAEGRRIDAAGFPRGKSGGRPNFQTVKCDLCTGAKMAAPRRVCPAPTSPAAANRSRGGCAPAPTPRSRKPGIVDHAESARCRNASCADRNAAIAPATAARGPRRA